MIFWTVYIPAISIAFIFFFSKLEVIFGTKVNRFRLPKHSPIRIKKAEQMNVLYNLIIFASMGFLLDLMLQKGLVSFQTIETWDSWNVLYLPVSLFIALFIHDVYFYLSHRLLHLPFVFRHVHRIHHQSHKVNAWSAFSFHPVEGVIQIGIVLLIPVLVPIHELIQLIFITFLIFISVYGHAGFEFRANKKGMFSIFNTAVHHAQHHEYVRYNFGIYLNFWDKLFKTNHPEYEKSFQELAQKINDSKVER